MALDEQLIDRSNQREQKADNSESNAPDSGSRAGEYRAATQEARNGAALDSQGDVRADKVAASRMQRMKRKINEAAKATFAPARKGLNSLLKSFWENLISSFGFTLFLIDIHVFLNMVFGDKLFCNLGEEWIPDKPAVPGVEKK